MSLDLSTYADLMRALSPESALTVGTLLVLMLVAWRHRTLTDLRLAGWATLVSLGVTAALVWWLWWNRTSVEGIAQMIAVDDFRFVTDWIFLGAAALTVLFSFRYLERAQLLAPEYYPLLLFAVLGMMFMGGGEDLMVIFLGLELMSISVYVLAGFNRKSPRAAEAALKYFLLGAFASAFLLYGIALMYGATGTTNLSFIGVQVQSLGLGHMPLFLIGVGLLLVGFGFKIAAVPFHMWAPDVYEGAPTPVTGFMAAGVKAAAIVAMVRVFGMALGGDVLPFGTLGWASPMVVIAAITITIGNITAVRQDNIKRMLAYSSISHAGVLMVGLCAMGLGSPTAQGATVYYLI